MCDTASRDRKLANETLVQLIGERRTAKRLSDPALRSAERDDVWTEAHHGTLASMIENAGAAPFHRRAHETHRQGATDSPVPWRFHVIERADCRRLVDLLEHRAEAYPDSEWSRAWQSKISAMLSGCGALVQATWLPDPERNDGGAGGSDGGGETVFTLANVEHVAAASAAVQNLLLLATAHGWHSYWSSGGILRNEALFNILGIGTEERLLGSIFLAPPEVPFDRLVSGGLRNERGKAGQWSRWVDVAPDA